MENQEKFIVYFSNAFTRDEIIESINHSLACILAAKNFADFELFREEIADPLITLHQFFFYQKQGEKQQKDEQDCLNRYIKLFGENEGKERFRKMFPKSTLKLK